ncbi:MAG: STAS domain-containing protein [Cytophagales bacterium]
MKFLIDKQEKFTLLQPQEEKIDSSIAPNLKSELVTVHAEGAKNIILDLSQVKYVDSSGLSAILTGNRVCSGDGGILVVASPSEHVMKLMKISQLDSVLVILPTKEEAIDAVFMNEIENDLKNEMGE